MKIFTDVLKSVFGSLNENKVRYLVVGGLAVAAHGHPRATGDIDIVVALAPENARRAIEALSKLNYRPAVPVRSELFADRETRLQWQREKGMLVFQMRTTEPGDVPVDLFITEPFNFEQVFPQALLVEVASGIEVPFVPYETLLKMKAEAGRPKDLEDIRILRQLHDA